MKNIIALFTLLMTATFSPALADIGPLGSAQNIPVINVLSNPGFENGLARITRSGGSLSLVTAGSHLGHGSGSAAWTPSGGSQTLATNQYAIPAGIQGRTCMGKILYQTAETTNQYLLQVIDQGSTVLASTTLSNSPNSGALFGEAYVPFTCPTSGTVALQIKTPASNPTNPIYIDDMHLGSFLNLSSMSQAGVYGAVKWPATTSCQWTRTSNATFGSYAAVSACTTPTGANIEGNASAPATKIPAISFSSMKPGTYIFHATGGFGHVGANRCAYAFYDGTTLVNAGEIGSASTATDVWGSTLIGKYTYTTAQSNKTIEIQATPVNASGTCNIDNVLAGEDLNIWAEYYPTSIDQGTRMDATPASWSGYFNTQCSWTTNATTYADAPNANASCNLVVRKNRNFGTVSPAGGTGTSALNGITFTPPRVGRYLVTSTVPVAESGTGHVIALQLTDGTTPISEIGFLPAGGGGYYSPVTVSGIYDATSTASVTLKLKMQINNGTISATAGNGGNTAASSAEWSIVELDAAMPSVAIIPNAPITGASAIQKIERVSFGGAGSLTAPTACTSSPCTIYDQSAGVSSVTWISAGTYVINFSAGTFSTRPTCYCSGDVAFAGYNCVRYSTNGSSSTAIGIQTINGAAAAGNSSVDVVCYGNK